MDGLRPYIRSIIYGFSLLIALAGYLYAHQFANELFYIRLEEWYGFSALMYIYFALLPSPLYTVFPSFPYGALYARARRAIGVSAFFFALLHSLIAFTALLNGFAGVPFLSGVYRIDLVLSSIALFILFLMAATSFDYALKVMGPWWKRLHRFLYLAGFFLILHVLLIGAHFGDPGSLASTILFTAVFVLLILEAIRFDTTFFLAKARYTPRFSWFTVLAVVFVTVLYMLLSMHGISSAHDHH